VRIHANWCLPQHPLWAGLRRRRQKAEQADRGLVLGLSSGLALLSLPLSSSSATKFSRPAAQHPLWAGLRLRRQKAEQADRGLVLGLSSSLALLSLPLSSSSATKFSRPAAQKAESRAEQADRGTTPSFLLQEGCDLVLSRCCLLYLLPAAYCLVHAACNKSARAGATAAGGRHGTQHRRRRCSAELAADGGASPPSRAAKRVQGTWAAFSARLTSISRLA
jgi:hypothetical protein